MKILFAASTKSHIVSFHLPYLECLKNAGFEVTVACANTEGEIPFASYVLELPFVKKMFALSNFKAMHILRKTLKAGNYDAIILHTSLAAFFARLAVFGIERRPKVINMVHGYLFDDSSPFFKRIVLTAAEKITSPVTDLVITMNEYDRNYAVSHKLAKRVSFVPGIGVNSDRFNKASLSKTEARKAFGIPHEAFVAIYAAEFSERKSHSVLIRALALLDKNVMLLMPGGGELLSECKELSQRLGVSQRCVFTGFVENVPMLFAAADCSVSASRSEGLPFNIMEAMLMGLPVVASAVKGHTDLVENEATGLLYPYGDIEACAAAIKRLMMTANLSRYLSAVASERVLDYTLDKVLPVVMEEYMSVLKNQE